MAPIPGGADRPLEDGLLEFSAISGNSAGALNGAALEGRSVACGREAARKRLRQLWEDAADIGDFRVLMPWFQPFLPMMRLMQEATEAMLPVSPRARCAPGRCRPLKG